MKNVNLGQIWAFNSMIVVCHEYDTGNTSLYWYKQVGLTFKLKVNILSSGYIILDIIEYMLFAHIWRDIWENGYNTQYTTQMYEYSS